MGSATPVQVTPPEPSWDVATIREQFPALSQTVNGKPLVYLDSAATALKPQCVIDAVVGVMSRDTANVHRGAHTLSQRATLAYEGVREKVARLIGAARDEIVFQHGTTEAMNLVAYGWGRRHLRAGDEVVLSGLEHHATIVPWQMAAAQTGSVLQVAPVSAEGEVSVDAVRNAIGERTRVVVVSHVSNTVGAVSPIAEIAKLTVPKGILLVVDGAQAVAHIPVDVAALGCDFYAFSGHKVYAPSGAGVLWGKAERFLETDPLLGGGDMIDTVTFERSTYAAPPHRFEAGTPPIAAVIGLGAAVDYLTAVGLERVQQHDRQLVRAAWQCLRGVPGLRLLGWPASGDSGPPNARVPVFSFVMDGLHSADLGTLVDLEGVAIRTGHHCAQPLMRKFGVDTSARASAGIYNTAEDFDVLVAALLKAKRMLS